MAEQESIIRKIQKLFALAGNNPSEEEAASAMTRAQELLAEYNLDIAMVQNAFVPGGTTAPASEKREKTKMTRSAQYQWQRELWRAVAEANFCWHWVIEVYEGKRGKAGQSKVPVKRHMILGRQSNVISVQLMCEYLEDTMERILPFPNNERLSRSAISWKKGCSDRLIERIQEKAERMKEESERRAATEGATTAITLASVAQREYADNYDARYGEGAYTRKLQREAEWELERQQEEEARKKAQAEGAKEAEEARQEDETPAQTKARVKREAQEHVAQIRRWARWERQKAKEDAKTDWTAYHRGHETGDTINLSDQIGSKPAKKLA